LTKTRIRTQQTQDTQKGLKGWTNQQDVLPLLVMGPAGRDLLQYGGVFVHGVNQLSLKGPQISILIKVHEVRDDMDIGVVHSAHG